MFQGDLRVAVVDAKKKQSKEIRWMDIHLPP
jgi:hypothetical protein